MVKFDPHGHIKWTPKELYQLTLSNPRHLVNDFLLSGTPSAFSERAQYYDFLEAVSDRIGVHPKNMFLRGSCQIGFSIAPRQGKTWRSMGDTSDLDLTIVDPDYFWRINQEVQRWVSDNQDEVLQGDRSHFYVEWEQDRRIYNCCRAKNLPLSVCVHHQDTMAKIAEMKHCGLIRDLNAFVFRDWWSVRRRYEFDLGQLRRGIKGRWLTDPGDEPLPPDDPRPADQRGRGIPPAPQSESQTRQTGDPTVPDAPSRANPDILRPPWMD